MKRIYWIFVVVCGMVLVACSQPDFLEEKASPTKVLETPIPARTLTPIPETKVSTSTPSITPTITRTFTPDYSPTPSPTHDRAGQRLLAPNGEYIAKTYGDYFSDEFRNWIEISDVNTGQVLWTIPEQIGDPGPSYELYQWAFDSSKFYYYLPFRYDGGILPLWSGRDLRSIDISNGEIKIIYSMDYLGSFSISQSAPLIAYYLSGIEPEQIYIRDLETGDERTVPIEPVVDPHYDEVGWIYWSPNNDALVFHTLSEDLVQTHYLNLETMAPKVVFEFPIEVYWFDSWTEEGNIRYFITTATYAEDPWYEYAITEVNIQTGEITELGKATPQPSSTITP